MNGSKEIVVNCVRTSQFTLSSSQKGGVICNEGGKCCCELCFILADGVHFIWIVIHSWC